MSSGPRVYERVSKWLSCFARADRVAVAMVVWGSGGSWAHLLAPLTLPCAAKPYWWHGGQPAPAATYRVNVHIKRPACTGCVHRNKRGPDSSQASRRSPCPLGYDRGETPKDPASRCLRSPLPRCRNVTLPATRSVLEHQTPDSSPAKGTDKYETPALQRSAGVMRGDGGI